LSLWKWKPSVHYSSTESSSKCRFKVFCQAASVTSHYPTSTTSRDTPGTAWNCTCLSSASLQLFEWPNFHQYF